MDQNTNQEEEPLPVQAEFDDKAFADLMGKPFEKTTENTFEGFGGEGFGGVGFGFGSDFGGNGNPGDFEFINQVIFLFKKIRMP